MWLKFDVCRFSTISLMPMAPVGPQIEASRAVALAAHSAAGLSASAGAREAARLLRSAEALARAATASLLALGPPAHCRSGDEAAAGPAAPLRRRQRPRRKMKNPEEDTGVSAAARVLEPLQATGRGPSPVTASPAPPLAQAHVAATARRLTAQASRERSPRRDPCGPPPDGSEVPAGAVARADGVTPLWVVQVHSVCDVPVMYFCKKAGAGIFSGNPPGGPRRPQWTPGRLPGQL